MLMQQPCPSPFDIEVPVSEEIKFIFGQAMARVLGPAQKRNHNISYWWGELDGHPIGLRIHEDHRAFLTYNKNDRDGVNKSLNLFIANNIMPTVKELEPKVIRQPHK